MPGLLQSTDKGLASLKFVAAFFAELIGVLLFTLYGSAAGRNSVYAPWGNGIALVVLVYATANVSGGHLNPAVTVATIFSGHIGPAAGIAYIIAQLSGACLGILLMIGLLPGLEVGQGDGALGCFAPGAGITRGQAFGWEAVMTFVLVAVVYAVAIGKPSFTETGPLAVGFSLWASAIIAGNITGAALNPARTLGPTFVFHCNWRDAWAYVLGELLGGFIAGMLSWPLYGTAGPWARAVLKPVAPAFGRLRSSLDNAVDNLPPALSSFFGLTATRKGNDTEAEDVEQGGKGAQQGGNGGQQQPRKRQQQQQQQHKSTPERGLLQGPGTPDESPQSQGTNHNYIQHDYQQQYAHQQQPRTLQLSNNQTTYEQYEPEPYVAPQGHGGSLTRSPSINMDWQTLQSPHQSRHPAPRF